MMRALVLLLLLLAPAVRADPIWLNVEGCRSASVCPVDVCATDEGRLGVRVDDTCIPVTCGDDPACWIQLPHEVLELLCTDLRPDRPRVGVALPQEPSCRWVDPQEEAAVHIQDT